MTDSSVAQLDISNLDYREIGRLNGQEVCREYSELIGKNELSVCDFFRLKQLEERIIAGVNCVLAIDRLLDKAVLRKKKLGGIAPDEE